MLSFCANPILKWAGGKQILAPKLLTLFPREIGRFYEPFVGGASVLLTLAPSSAVIGDQNGWLLDTYVAIRSDWRRVADYLDGMVNSREEYTRLRRVDPGTLTPHARAAHLIYLNKTCFRGLFRVNRQGRFNVPYGEYDRRYYDPDNLRAVAAALEEVEIRYADFELSLRDINAADFAYLDPPYYKLGGYSDFNRYTPWQFRESDHVRLAAFCRELDLRGVRWAVSNSDTPFIRELFAGYRIEALENRREINLKSQRRTVTELLILNYAAREDTVTFGRPTCSPKSK